MILSPSAGSQAFSNENSATLMMRKPDSNTLLGRKAFADRAVNFKSPMPQRQPKSLLEQRSKSTSDIDDELCAFDYAFSYRDVEDSYEDILPRFTEVDLENVLRNFYHPREVSTPPPQEVSFFPLDEPNMSFEYEPMRVESCGESFFRSENEAFKDVAPPSFDFDDFDMFV